MKIQRLLDPFTVQREPPANLAPADEYLFRHEYSRDFDATDLFEFRNIVLTSDGEVIRRLRIVKEVEFASTIVQAGSRYVLGSLRRARPAPVGAGEEVIAAFNPWSGNNYFHWMCDVLPRIWLLRERVPESTLLLPASHDVPFVHRTLAPFAPRRVVFFDPAQSLWLRRVLVPGHIGVTGNYHVPTTRSLAQLLCESAGVDPVAKAAAARTGRLVYVTRRRAAYRHVLNEVAVIPMLERLGFEIVENESLSFDDQVRLHAGSRALVGIMGANLTNVMFMPEGSAVLQLSKRADAHNNLYWSLASAVGVGFHYQQCDYVDTRPGDYWNVTVDVPALEANLRGMLDATA